MPPIEAFPLEDNVTYSLDQVAYTKLVFSFTQILRCDSYQTSSRKQLSEPGKRSPLLSKNCFVRGFSVADSYGKHENMRDGVNFKLVRLKAL